MITLLIVMGAFSIGCIVFSVWFVWSEACERNKHYQIVVTINSDDDTMVIHKSKLTKNGKRTIVIYPAHEMPLLSIDVRLSDSRAVVTDMR